MAYKSSQPSNEPLNISEGQTRGAGGPQASMYIAN